MSEPQQAPLLQLEEKPPNTVEDLLRVAQEASAEIEAIELALVEEEKWLNTQRYRLEQMEANCTRIVAAARVDPDDRDSKLLFTNDGARKAEVSRRLGQDPAHKEAMAALLVAETEQKVRRIKLDRLNRDYAMAKLNYAAITLGRKGLGELDI